MPKSHSVKKFEQTYYEQFYKSNSIEYNRKKKLRIARQNVKKEINNKRDGARKFNER